MSQAKEKISEHFLVADLMEQIRTEVLSDIEANKDKPLQFNPYKANSDSNPQAKAGDLLYSEELRYLNERWAYANRARGTLDQISSHRPGLLGKLIVKLKRKFAVSVWDSILKPYFEEEKDFQANLVRFLNQTSKYVDQRDASNFWELIRKIDVDITNALERIERINDEQTANLRSSEKSYNGSIGQIGKEISGLQEYVSNLSEQVKTLDSVAKGVEAIVARASRMDNSSASNEQTDSVQFTSDQSYVLLENRYRGSEEMISQRVSIYPPLFADVYRSSNKPVLEIGGGRGELQVLFKEQKINSYSIDIDPAMVEAGKQKAVDIRLGDGIAHLQSLPDRSLSGVIAIQVVEHLTQDQLKTLFTLCNKKVVDGGIVIFETINPRSIVALSSNYFRDPTHVWPLHPDTLSFQMGLYGLETVETRFLSAIPTEAGIEQIPQSSHMTPMWKESLYRINRNFSKLHSLLYGEQDYCIIAKVKA